MQESGGKKASNGGSVDHVEVSYTFSKVEFGLRESVGFQVTASQVV